MSPGAGDGIPRGTSEPARVILLVDNYDSFVHNLARYLRRLGQRTLVVRNDAIDVAGAVALRPQAIVLSPGPCTPQESGASLLIARELLGRVPLLGVCLGHQAIAAAHGGRVVRADQPMHGRSSLIEHDGRGEFAGAPSPLMVGRYHSLVVDESSLPERFEVTARSCEDRVVMAFRDTASLAVGLQFHPESVLTRHGFLLLANFLRSAGCELPERLPTLDDEQWTEPASPEPAGPVTF